MKAPFVSMVVLLLACPAFAQVGSPKVDKSKPQDMRALMTRVNNEVSVPNPERSAFLAKAQEMLGKPDYEGTYAKQQKIVGWTFNDARGKPFLLFVFPDLKSKYRAMAKSCDKDSGKLFDPALPKFEGTH